MRGTGSTRTAMRWSSSDRPRLLATRCVLRGAWCVVAALSIAACVTTTSHYYVPSAGEERLNVDEARDALDQMLGAECPRLMEAKHPSAASNVLVDVDRGGAVVRAQLRNSTGDKRIDDIFGAIAARMHFEAPPANAKGDTQPGRLRIGYSCSATAAVSTVELL